MAEDSSRLYDGNIVYQGKSFTMAEYRDKISARNLYNLDNEYQNTNLFSLRNQGDVASGIATVLAVVPQYNRIQSNLFGNAVDAAQNESALSRIGLVMLGKQMAYNSAMNLSVKYLPTIDFSQALKGNPKGIFKKNEDNTITVENKDGDNYTFGDKVGGFLSNFLGVDTYDVFGNANPFSKNPTNIEYIKNTGNAQLTRFYKAINMNIYKPINEPINANESKVINDYAIVAGVEIDASRRTTVSGRRFFTFDDLTMNPYWNNSLNSKAYNADTSPTTESNKAMIASYSSNTTTYQGYAPTQDYIDNNFGRTTEQEVNTVENYVGERASSVIDTNETKLVWGRDGVSEYAGSYVRELRGDDENNNPDNNIQFPTGVKTGLLEYTRNLLNATSGQYVDITRKAFKNGKGNIVGFNGSPLWRANDSKYAIDSGNNIDGVGKAGIRQHTVLDPYDRFAKLIRFKGNVVYNGGTDGNQNSVIYNTVYPRIHPTKDRVNDKNKLNNKNLMFSIENLAIGTIARDTYGVIDDEYGTAIPLSEVGPFAGRMMWFPPYALELNEVAIAKYESTVMVGRNEPMYNYMNSERTAVLSFMLLMDYPEQLRNYTNPSENRNKDIADFFAFGGDPLPAQYNIEEWEKQVYKLRDSIPDITSPNDPAEPPEVITPVVGVYFPNDFPNDNEIDTAFDTMYKNPNHYEIMENLLSADNGNGFGLNKDFYFITGVSANTNQTEFKLVSFVPQYTSIGRINQYDTPSLLNDNLYKVYGNEENRKYYDITIEGTASKLYLNKNEKEYNEKLGNRRIDATIKLIQSRLTAMFGASVADDIVKNRIKRVNNIGSSLAGPKGAEAKNMHLKEVKQERSASVKIERNDVSVELISQNLTQKQKDEKEKILKEIDALETKILTAKNGLPYDNVLNTAYKPILDGFEAHSGNFYSPAYHSQTPEEFHRRLTFLQQCTRQGAAKRYDVKDENGELRARNSVFGRQPICILRVGDFWYTKVIIESVTVDYNETTWDMNPEGFGMQPMRANITLQMKLIGGQSLKGPIDALQNAVSFNYYANSTFTDAGMYAVPSKAATDQDQFMNGVNGYLTTKKSDLLSAYQATDVYKIREGEQ